MKMILQTIKKARKEQNMLKKHYQTPQAEVCHLVSESRILTGSTEQFDLGNEFPGFFEEDVIDFSSII